MGKINNLSSYAIGVVAGKSLVKIGKMGGMERGIGDDFVCDLVMAVTIVFQFLRRRVFMGRLRKSFVIGRVQKFLILQQESVDSYCSVFFFSQLLTLTWEIPF